MKKKLAVLMVAGFLISMLSGCSLFSIYDLTEDEANTIAVYSAHVVSKYNRYMAEGLVYPSEIDEEETEDDTSSDEQTADDPEQSAQETGQSETESEDLSADEEQNESGDSGNEDTSTEQTSEEQSSSYVSFTDAVGIDGIKVSYVDYDVTDAVMESTYFSLNAAAGKTYLVINLKVKNENSGATRVDILGSSPRFRININDETKVLSQTTLLLSDFSTMSENVRGGKTKEKKLIFEVASDAVSDIETLVLDVTLNDNTSRIKLL